MVACDESPRSFPTHFGVRERKVREKKRQDSPSLAGALDFLEGRIDPTHVPPIHEEIEMTSPARDFACVCHPLLRGFQVVPASIGRVGMAMVMVVTCLAGWGHADEAGPDAAQLAFTIGDGGFSLSAPTGWTRVEPKSRIVETEFAVPAEGGLEPGRMTVMGAGGSIEANIERWFGQFSQPDGSATKDHAALKKLSIAGCKVTVVDVSGTFRDMPGGPFAGGKTVERPDYRMLAAIVETPAQGNYFLKFYGPAVTVTKYVDGFQAMVEGLVPAS